MSNVTSNVTARTAIIVYVTASSDAEAKHIADALITEQLAACCNICPGIRSIYMWEGKLCDEKEVLLLIKSFEDCFEALAKKIKLLHSYKVPEIIAVPLTKGDEAYLRWMEEVVPSKP